MASKDQQQDTICRRCGQDSVITIRTEPLCRECFSRYVHTKVVKRMETFRVRKSDPDKQRRILLPLSLGPASITLLHVLTNHLKRQGENTRRTGYGLHVLHIHNGEEPTERLQELKTRYSEHEYSTCPLSDVLLQEDATVRDLFPSTSSHQSANDQLVSLLSSLSSNTARADVFNILRTRLIVAFAKAHGLDTVVWGDSTTRLAEKALAETAKGRGYALPWLVNDGLQPQGLLFYYPLRDLLKKEIVSFAGLNEPPLPYIKDEIVTTVSSRNATIDSLMQQYFESAEKDYPSIVANVVRTTSKLEAAALADVEQHCELCGMPLQASAPEKSRLCYACIRSFA